jgi:hypothetical protein
MKDFVKIYLKNPPVIKEFFENPKWLDKLANPDFRKTRFYKGREDVIETLADPNNDIVDRANNAKELLFMLKDEHAGSDRMGLRAITEGQYHEIYKQLERISGQKEIKWVVDMFSEAPYHLDEDGNKFLSSTLAIDKAVETEDRDYVGIKTDYLEWSKELYGGNVFDEDVSVYIDKHMEERSDFGVIIIDSVCSQYGMPSFLNTIKQKRPNCVILARFLQDRRKSKIYRRRETMLEWGEAIDDLYEIRDKFEETITGPDYDFVEVEKFFEVIKEAGCIFSWYKLS